MFSQESEAPRATTPSASPAAEHLTYTVPDALLERFEPFVRDSLRYRRVSPATAKWYRDTFRTFLKYLTTEGVKVITAGTTVGLIREWLASSLDGEHRTASTQAKKGISPFTANSYWQALRAFFVYLEETDKFPNPFRTLAQPDTPDVMPKALTHAQCVRVLAAARSADWQSPYERARAVAMIAMALYSGLRRNEILTVEFDNVQIDDQRIVILRGKGRAGGKGRVAYINRELQAILQAYVEARREAHLTSVEFFTAIVPRRGGGRAAAAMRRDPEARKHSGHGVKSRTFNRIVARVRETAGFHFSLHMLRHSFVSMLARQPNVSVQHIRELAGHRDMKTTERYMRLFEEDKLSAVSTLSFTSDAAEDPRRDAASDSPPRTPARRHGYSG